MVVEDQVTLVNEGLGMIKVVLLFFVSPIHVDNKDAVILGIKQNLKVFWDSFLHFELKEIDDFSFPDEIS